MDKLKIGNTTFDLDYCKTMSPDRLRIVYNGEPKETIDLLIGKISGAKLKDVIDVVKEVKVKK